MTTDDSIERPRSGGAGGNGPREPDPGEYYESDLEEYEEPDRDTDYASGYGAEDVIEEEEFTGGFSGDDEDPPPEGDAPGEHVSPIGSESNDSAADEPPRQAKDMGRVEKKDNKGTSWPLSLVAVAIIALVLLIAGGYGVMQERAATQAELRELRATLATAGNPEEARKGREALRELQDSYDALSAKAQALSMENQRLTDAVTGLEAQLNSPGETPKEAAQPVTDNTASPEAALPEPVEENPAPPAPEPPPAATEPDPPEAVTNAAVAPGRWFVNFGSYTSRATAETWASRLQPGAGEVVVVPGAKDGRTYYRVRVVGLRGQDSANRVARQLEADLQVSTLWVGQD